MLCRSEHPIILFIQIPSPMSSLAHPPLSIRLRLSQCTGGAPSPWPGPRWLPWQPTLRAGTWPWLSPYTPGQEGVWRPWGPQQGTKWGGSYQSSLGHRPPSLSVKARTQSLAFPLSHPNSTQEQRFGTHQWSHHLILLFLFLSILFIYFWFRVLFYFYLGVLRFVCLFLCLFIYFNGCTGSWTQDPVLSSHSTTELCPPHCIT